MTGDTMTASGRRHNTAVTYAWGSPEVALTPDAQVERTQRLCEERGWQVTDQIRSRRYPELIELMRRALESDATHVVLTKAALDHVAQRFPEVWNDVRTRLEVRGVRLIVC